MGHDWKYAVGEDVGDIGVDVQTKVEYDANNNPIYIGHNRQDKTDNDENWIIYKLLWDANGNMIHKQRMIGRWIERTTLTWR